MTSGRDLVSVEADEPLAGVDHISLIDVGRESVTLHLYGIQADVDEKLEVIGKLEANGMA